MPNGLILSSHYAKGHEYLTLFAQHGRNDGMHGPRFGFQFVRVAFGQVKPGAAVLEQDAVTIRCNSRPKAFKNGIDQRNRHTVFIYHCDVDRIFVMCFAQRALMGPCFVRINQRSKAFCGLH